MRESFTMAASSSSPVAEPGHATAQRTTLQDIARALDVSPSLVSKVLNRRLRGRSSASKQKVQAIFDKARELDYQKNAMATALVKGRQDAMAVYVHEHGVEGSEITSRTIKGVAAATARLGQRLMLHYYSTPEEFARLIPMAHRSNVDGLILVGIAISRSADALDQLLRRQLPVVTVYDRQVHPGFPNVGLDQSRLSAAAVRHLIDRGCRRIGLIDVPSGGERRAGYLRTLAEAGLEHDPRLIAHVTGFSASVGEQAVHAWRSQQVEFDAVVGLSDQHAAGAINALLRLGRRVPEDVKVIGIDNSPFCDFYIVPISSVSQETTERGELAAVTLHHLIRNEPAPSVVINPRLHIRESTGG